MRDKFSELIAQGVAKFDYKPIAPDTTEQDPVCRMYNNIWSIPSDTHMSLCPVTGNRYITGSMVAKEKWNEFVYANFWGAVNFKPAGYWCLCDFLQKNGLCGRLSTLNGDVVYEIVPCAGDDCPVCHGSAPVTCTTTESRIPDNAAKLTVDGNLMKIRECYNGKSNLYEVCEALNESIYVLGKDWTVVGNNVMCPIGNKTYIL